MSSAAHGHGEQLTDILTTTFDLPSEATETALKSAYRALALKLHPDKNQHLSPACKSSALALFKSVSSRYQLALELIRKRDRGDFTHEAADNDNADNESDAFHQSSSTTSTRKYFNEPSPGAFLDPTNPFVPTLEEVLQTFQLDDDAYPKAFSERRADVLAKLGNAQTDVFHKAPGHKQPVQRIKLKTEKPAPPPRRNLGKDALEASHLDTKSFLWSIYGEDKKHQIEDKQQHADADNSAEAKAITNQPEERVAATQQIYAELTDYDSAVQRMKSDPKSLVLSEEKSRPRSFYKAGIGAPNPSVPFNTKPRQAPEPHTPADHSVPMTRPAPRMHRNQDDDDTAHGINWRGRVARTFAPGTCKDGPSAWNGAGTWEERDVTSSVISQLESRLAACESAMDDGTRVSIAGPPILEGEANIVISRGRRYAVLDFDATLPFRIDSEDGEIMAQGSLRCMDFSLDAANNSERLEWTTSFSDDDDKSPSSTSAVAALASIAEEVLLDVSRNLVFQKQ